LESTTTVIESQLDWLTVGTHAQDTTDLLRGMATDLVEMERDAGGRVRPFRLQGFIGWQCGRVRFGQREDRGLMQLSGDLAAQRFTHVMAVQDNVSRIDLAVTVRAPASYTAWPARNYSEAFLRRADDATAALPKLVEDGAGGSTFYLGDRSSDWFLRVYNKEAEQVAQHDRAGAQHYQACCRWELEVKGVNAPRVAKLLSDPHTRADDVQALLWSYCTEHGLTLPFRAWRRSGSGPGVPPSLGPRDSNGVAESERCTGGALANADWFRTGRLGRSGAADGDIPF
jgi:hypothetical protein